MDDAKPLQIVKVNDSKFELDEKLLSSVLNRWEIKDRKAVVVSIAGAFHKEKSELLEFFLRYLYDQYGKKDRHDWMEKSTDISSKELFWNNRSDADTSGIWMWSDVFTHNFGTQRIAIILMDTQGVFINPSTAKNSTFVFTLSTLMSSVQIYNLSQNAKENDLIKSARHHIKSCFSEIDCFLMPKPGLTVCEEQAFQGGASDSAKNKFKDQLKDLIPSLVAPKKLKIKAINEQQILAGELTAYFKNYVGALEKDKIIKPLNILNATAEASHMTASQQAKDLYYRENKRLRNDAKIPESVLKEKDDEIRKQSLQLFDSKKKMGTADITKKYREKLVNELKFNINHKQNKERNKESSQTKVTKDFKKDPSQVKSKDFKDSKREQTQQKSKDSKDFKKDPSQVKSKDFKDSKTEPSQVKSKDFKDSKKEPSQVKSKDSREFKDKKKEFFQKESKDSKNIKKGSFPKESDESKNFKKGSFQKDSEQNKNFKKEPSQQNSKECYLKAKKVSTDHYENEMNKLFVQNKFLEDDTFEEQHKKIRGVAWAKFMSTKGSDGDGESFKQCKTELFEHINTCYSRYVTINNENRGSAGKAGEGTLLLAIKESKKSYSMAMENYFMHVKYVEEFTLKQKHEMLEKSILAKFREEMKDQTIANYNELQTELNILYQGWVNRNYDKKRIHFAEIDARNVKARENALIHYRSSMEDFFHNMGRVHIPEKLTTKKHNEFKHSAELKYSSEALNESNSFMHNLGALQFEMDGAFKQYLDAIKREDDNQQCTIS